MQFDTYFKFNSYAVAVCGALSLFVAGGVNVLAVLLFAVAVITAWWFEGTKWQLSERVGLVVIVLSLPLFYLDWQYQAATLPRERAAIGTLAHLILGLSAAKLWQTKHDRDWIFLYLIAFFEILLAAGLSVSPSFLAVLMLYLLFTVSTIIAFEIRRAGRHVKILDDETASLAVGIGGNPTNRKVIETRQRKTGLVSRLPIAAVGILLLVAVFAVPLFFTMPRVGGAGYGRGAGATNFVGFSDSVELGAIGQLQQNDAVVMRVRIEQPGAIAPENLRWRGIALDRFDNKNWSRSSREGRNSFPLANGIFQYGSIDDVSVLTEQTVYLEPISAPYLFFAGRAVAVQGSFPVIKQDLEGTLSVLRNAPERITYKVYADARQPSIEELRRDNKPNQAYINNKYLQLPERVDSRIAELAKSVVRKSGARTRYDAVRAVERHLQEDYGYTLDLKAGGSQPVADFLFNVREGHCEYFASAMTVMLRTQGIAARVVNGFQTGEYNDAAGAYIVTQRNAHSWVEVYFPDSGEWVTFDPTPAAGRELTGGGTPANPIAAQMRRYFDALEMFWVQYIVAYDNQEQRSLARTVRERLAVQQTNIEDLWRVVKVQLLDFWRSIQGQRGVWASLTAVLQLLLGVGALIVFGLLMWLAWRRVGKLKSWRKLWSWRHDENAGRVVEFYERMTRALGKRGLRREPHQTPLEFADELKMPEAVLVTEAYNRVRFGEQDLTLEETAQVERWLLQLEKAEVVAA